MVTVIYSHVGISTKESLISISQNQKKQIKSMIFLWEKGMKNEIGMRADRINKNCLKKYKNTLDFCPG